MDDKGNGKYQLDLWKSNEIVMREAGVLKEHLAIGAAIRDRNPEKAEQAVARHLNNSFKRTQRQLWEE